MEYHEQVKELFVETAEGDYPPYPLNTELELQFSDEWEGAKFLVEALRFWQGKREFFCLDYTWEEEWAFNYKTPSTCGSCESGQEILDKIFGDHKTFNALPFVKYLGERVYEFWFASLKDFAENGRARRVSELQGKIEALETELAALKG